jgi:hypothetical protein
MNVRRIASGPVAEAFTEQNLRLAYGGRVAFLNRNGTTDQVGAGNQPLNLAPHALTGIGHNVRSEAFREA